MGIDEIKDYHNRKIQFLIFKYLILNNIKYLIFKFLVTFIYRLLKFFT